MKFLPLLILGFALCGSAVAQSLPLDLQEDHIAANVPSQEVFATYLERDLLAYFRSEVSPEVMSVTSVMLRDGATQSGVAYPKFYLWVQAAGKSGTLAEGAVRLAAIDRKGFEVTHFISSADILADPTRVSSVFPEALAPSIATRAAHK
jgi:hypothetical protein